LAVLRVGGETDRVLDFRCYVLGHGYRLFAESFLATMNYARSANVVRRINYARSANDSDSFNRMIDRVSK
jgi:hypothetical protein